MKKTLVAIAAITAFSAYAQSSVTVFGIVDQAYQTNKQTSRDGTLTQSGTYIGAGSLSGSRFGLRGEEDMGGGTKAEFWIEQGIEPSVGDGFNTRTSGNGLALKDSATTVIDNNRQTWVGLKGDFGAVRLGRIYGLAYDSWTFNGFIIGENAGNGQAGSGISSRIRGVQYTSATFNGLTFAAQLGGTDSNAINVSGNTDSVLGYKSARNDYKSFRAMYSNGPLRTAFTYENLTQNCAANAATTTNVYGGSVAVGTCTNTGDAISKNKALNAAYNFGPAELIAIAGFKDLGRLDSATDTYKEKLLQYTVKVPVGSWMLGFNAYSRKKDNVVAGTAKEDWKGNYLLAQYNLSKRTAVYFSTGYDKDGVGTNAVTNEVTRSGLGVFHTF